MEKKDDQRNKKLAKDKKRMEYSDRNTKLLLIQHVLKALQVQKALIPAVGISLKYEGCDDITNLYATFAQLTW